MIHQKPGLETNEIPRAIRRPPLNCLTLLALVLSTGLALAMFGVRVAYTGRITHAYLVWNLFLAWLPLLFAGIVWLGRRRRLLFMAGGFMWLLFLPNAPYLITDLIHLRPLDGAPTWYDAVLFFTFALLGLLLCYQSLFQVQTAVAERLGRPAGWLVVLCALILSSFGIYIGRFLRWNSWDLFLHPLALPIDIWQNLLLPHQQYTALATILLFSSLTIGAYFVLVAAAGPLAGANHSR